MVRSKYVCGSQTRGKSLRGFQSFFIFFWQKCGFKYMPISLKNLYLQEYKKHFLEARPFIIEDAKNNRNPVNLSC